jgi:hypothetical protein
MLFTHRSRLILAATAIAVGTFTPPVHADPLPTLDEMKQMLKDDKAKELTPMLARAISLKGPDADQYPKRDLYELKGEVSLKTKARQAAIDSYVAAAKSTDKPDEAAADTGMALLVKASGGNLKYTPKPPRDKDKTSSSEKPEPIDIVDPDSRKKALAALARDMLAVDEPKVTAAVKGTDLAQMVTVGKSLVDLRAVEIAGTGAPTDSKQLMGDLGNRATKLLGDSLDNTAKNLEDLITAYENQNKPAAAGRSQKSVSNSDLGRAAAGASSSAKAVQSQARELAVTFGEVADFKLIDQKAKALISGADKIVSDVKAHGG